MRRDNKKTFFYTEGLHAARAQQIKTSTSLEYLRFNDQWTNLRHRGEETFQDLLRFDCARQFSRRELQRIYLSASMMVFADSIWLGTLFARLSSKEINLWRFLPAGIRTHRPADRRNEKLWEKTWRWIMEQNFITLTFFVQSFLDPFVWLLVRIRARVLLWIINIWFEFVFSCSA